MPRDLSRQYRKRPVIVDIERNQKSCTHCGVMKPADDYYRGKGPLGRVWRCRSCARKQTAEQRAKSPTPDFGRDGRPVRKGFSCSHITPIQQFERLIRKTVSCWIWIGNLTEDGYGRFRVRKRLIPAHRFSYEHFKGPIPDGLQIDHLCRVRHCVNPEHLEAVTPHENWLRGQSPAALNAVKTHCKRGHEFTPENTIVTKGGRGRTCRACEANRLAREKQSCLVI